MLKYYKHTSIISFILLLLLSTAFTFAQGTLEGKVTDAKGKGIIGANVFLKGTTLGAASDLDGSYKIERIPEGSYTLIISALGYKQQEFNISVETGKTYQQNAQLEEDILNLDAVVVVGTAGGSGVLKKDASFAITTITPRELERLSPPSTAAALDLVPGVWSESSGGVAGANIFVRGLPSSGDAPFVTMSINGAPIYGTQTLSFFEQSTIFRIDETVGTTEALRGGPSSVFSNGEAGLTTNFNLKRGTNQTMGRVKYTTSDYSEQRVDAVLSGPVSENFYYMVGGYARTSPGIRNTEFNSENGGQFTVQLTRTFNRGVVNGFARLTNDHGQWILPMALGTGNEAGTFSPLGNATRYRTLRVNAQGDSAHYDFSQGRGWKGVISGLNFDYELGGGWIVRDNLSYTAGDANTLGFVPNGNPMSVSALSAKLGGKPVQTVGGRTLTSGYVQSYGHWVVEKQLESFTNDISLTNEVADHKITIGAFQSFWSSQDFWTLGNHIGVENVTNGDVLVGGSATADSISGRWGYNEKGEWSFSGGSWNYGLNESGDARVYAVYAGDSWQVTDKLRLDLGVRYHFFNLNFTLDHGAWPDGTIDRTANLDGTDWAGTAAVNYAVTNNFGVFIRGSKGSLFPNFDQIRENVGYKMKEEEAGSNPLSIKGTLETNLFNQFELGIKVDQKLYSLFVTGFLNTVEVFDGDVGAARAAALLKTRTFGAEVDAALSVEGFKVNLVGTFQNGEITESSDKTAEGNKVWRQPDFQFRLAPSYNFQLTKNIAASIFGAVRYVGKRWNDRDNSYQLDAYSKLDLGIDISTAGGLTFSVIGDNIGDSDGLTEGDPRDPTTQNGRPILGRSVRFSVGVNF